MILKLAKFDKLKVINQLTVKSLIVNLHSISFVKLLRTFGALKLWFGKVSLVMIFKSNS